MSANRQLKIGADTTELKKSILELSKLVGKDLGKSKIDLFTPETKKLLQGEAKAQAAALKKQMDLIRDSAKQHAAAMQNVVKGSKEELKLKEKILKASVHIAKLSKEQQKVSSFGDAKGGAFLGGLGESLKRIPMLGRLAGMGALGGAGLLAGGGLLGAGMYGISRVRAARETYSSGIDSRIRLRGRGVSDMMPTNTQDMLSAGLNSISLREARLRDMDVFGRSGSTQAEVIRRAQFERNFGIEQGTMSGIGSGFRSSMGGQGANQTLMKLQASLIASGISDAIGPYLETASQMLTELNERGFTMDESVMSLFNSMLKTGMGEGRIQRLAMGVDSGIRGATGESNAMFQNIFTRAGIGGGTIGGAQAAMRMGGLFGADLSKYKAMGSVDRQTFEALGIGGAGHMQGVASNTLGQLDRLFGSGEDIQKQLGSGDQNVRQGGALKRLSRLRYVMQSFGLKDEGQAAEVEGLLRQASTASPEEQKNIMRKVQDIKESTPELENLRKINSSNEGIFELLKNEKTTIEEAIGEATSGAFNTMNTLLNSIDKAILSIAETFGYESPERAQLRAMEDQATLASNSGDARKRLLSGNISNRKHDLTQMLQGQSFEENQEFADIVKQRMLENQNKGFGQKDSRWETIFNSQEFAPFKQGQDARERRRIRELGNGGNSPAATPIPASSPASTGGVSSDLTRAQLEAQRQTNRLLESVNRNTRERGTLKPGTGSTTGM